MLSGYTGRVRESRNGVKLDFSLQCITFSGSGISRRVSQDSSSQSILDFLSCLQTAKCCIALLAWNISYKQVVILYDVPPSALKHHVGY